MKDIKDNILLIGIGNNGRSDDGLGWALADVIEATFPELKVVYRYQLQIEDAEMISHFKTVVFVDSTVEYFQQGYDWKILKPAVMGNFTSHALEPRVILGLCEMIYDYKPSAYQLAITGENWDLCNELGPTGKQHLKAAVDFALNEIERLVSVQQVI